MIRTTGRVFQDPVAKAEFENLVRQINSQLTSFQKTIDAISAPTSLAKATGAEVTAGTDDTKYVTPKAVDDSDLARVGDIPSVPVKASGAEINIKTDDAKYVTSKAIADSDIAFMSDIPAVPAKASGTDVATGTDDDKYVTSKAITDSGIIPGKPASKILTTAFTTSSNTFVDVTGFTFTVTSGKKYRILIATNLQTNYATCVARVGLSIPTSSEISGNIISVAFDGSNNYINPVTLARSTSSTNILQIISQIINTNYPGQFMLFLEAGSNGNVTLSLNAADGVHTAKLDVGTWMTVEEVI